jgi:16S rRNA (adenine1518-N6/adenine1519-N6)-dimethyltransferase
MTLFCGTGEADASQAGSRLAGMPDNPAFAPSGSTPADLVSADAVSAFSALPLPPLRDVIAAHGLAARHSLGQHFLLDGNLTARIARAAGDLSGRNVIEIGPGPGGLTRALLESGAARIVAIELDKRAVAAIEALAAVSDGRLRVIEADAMRVDLPDQVPAPRQIVANLPYNVASPLLVRWLRQASAYERMTLMFQREVAERIVAAPNTEAYGRLSVLAGWICDCHIAVRLPPAAFVPPPKVWSAVVVLTPRPEQPPAGLFAVMERLTAAAFGQRRKMLRGSLKQLGGETLLKRADIAPDRRAETLSVMEFDRLVRLL